MMTIMLTIHIIIAVALVAVVLLQRSEGGGLGIGGGGQGGGFMTARGTANMLTRLTAILAACFFTTSIILAILSGGDRNTPSVVDEVIQENSGSPANTVEPSVPTDQ